MRIVVTGGAGFIGGNLCRLLSSTAQVDEVVVVDDLSTGFRENVEGLAKVRLVEGSVLDRALLRDAVAGAASVVHLAARPSVPLSLADPVASHHVNVTGTVEVLEAARESGSHVVVASSSAVYGDGPVTPKHEDLPQCPVSPYGVTKVATEGYALAYRASFGVPTLALRFFNVFGPLQPAGHAYAAVVPAFVEAAITGRPLPVHGDGRQIRDFVYVGTVARVLAEAALGRVTHEAPVNLASGSRTDLLGLIELLEGILGHPLERRHLPVRPGDIRDSQADTRRLAQLFPDVRPAPLVQGLRETVQWWAGRSERDEQPA